MRVKKGQQIRVACLEKPKSNCKADWCGYNSSPFISLLNCIGSSLSNVQRRGLKRVGTLTRTGFIDKAMSELDIINRQNHLAFLLAFNQYNKFYHYRGDECSEYVPEDVVTCKDIACIREQLFCKGIDIECIMECFDMCDYHSECDPCKDIPKSDNIIRPGSSANVFTPIPDNV